jgi:uncharacterized damage-inducible protein DinB
VAILPSRGCVRHRAIVSGQAMKQHFLMFAAYNRWANEGLYEACESLTDEEFTRDVGAFFRSMMGTLNHLLVADRIWMHRFTGEGALPKALDEIVHPNLVPLSITRAAEDNRIIEWLQGLDEEAIAGRFTYTTVTDMRRISQRLAPALAHLFNHQTHHRGQAHTLLSLLGQTPPSLDLVYFQRSEEGRVFA